MAADKNRRIRENALGWLEIEIRGEHPEHLLNLALQQGIELYQVRRYGEHKLRARLLLRDVYALRPLLLAAHCRFRVKKRAGWPFWLARGWRNISLVAGGLLFALALYMACSFVWRVDVESLYPLSAAEREQVLNLAAEAGLSVGCPAFKLDYTAISAAILTGAPELVFAQVERQGVKALIHIVRRTDVQAEDRGQPPGDIVAVADGLIENILVKSGTAAVKPGDTVKSGDVLVYGMGGGRLVTAAALIEARVWGEGIGSWPRAEQGLRPSGVSCRGLLLRFGAGQEAPAVWLWGGQPAYEHFTYDSQALKPVLWRNIVLPVELVLNTWYEQQPYATSYSKEQALYHAGQRALAQAVQKLPGRCDLLRQTTRELPAAESQVNVQVIWEGRADIGRFVPLDEARIQQYEQTLSTEQDPLLSR